MKLSVIIPTYNRKEILKKCLNGLFNQTCSPPEYEIIVVDDGSTDETEELVKSMINDSPCVIRYFKQENRGPAAARNIGIKNANSEIVLFIGDDIIADRRLIEEHIKFHFFHPVKDIALLGYVTWSKELKITPFMHWLENGGPQFAYWRLKDGEEVSYEYFYTCNISLKREFSLENGLFDEDFRYPAFEDTELGYRLQEKGLRIMFHRNAAGYHFHPTNMQGFCQREKLSGRSAVVFHEKWPMLRSLPQRKGLKKVLESSRRIIIPIIKPIVAWADRHNIRVPGYFYCKILSYYYYLGVEESKKRGYGFKYFHR